MLPSMSLPQEIIARAAELHAGEAAHLFGLTRKNHDSRESVRGWLDAPFNLQASSR
jgi:hypothetical protein